MNTILLVEDESSLREVVASVLEDEGFTVVVAVDGCHALQILTGQRPQLVLTDVMMPRMDGRELLRNLRSSREWASIPVVMISAVALPDPELMEVQAFVPKPFDFDVLLETIREILDHRE